MLIAIIGESCTGKSTLADKLKDELSATIYTGKDYLRLAKNEAEAKNIFKNKLSKAINSENIIYVIAEKEHLELLPEETFKILVTADLPLIKERFKLRMRGNLPKPVEMMLEKNHGMFNNINYDYHYDNGDEIENLLMIIKEYKCNLQ